MVAVERVQQIGLAETGDLQVIEVVASDRNSRRIESALPQVGENGNEGGTVSLELLGHLNLVEELHKPLVQQRLPLLHVARDAILQRQTLLVLCS